MKARLISLAEYVFIFGVVSTQFHACQRSKHQIRTRGRRLLSSNSSYDDPTKKVECWSCRYSIICHAGELNERWQHVRHEQSGSPLIRSRRVNTRARARISSRPYTQLNSGQEGDAVKKKKRKIWCVRWVIVDDGSFYSAFSPYIITSVRLHLSLFAAVSADTFWLTCQAAIARCNVDWRADLKLPIRLIVQPNAALGTTHGVDAEFLTRGKRRSWCRKRRPASTCNRVDGSWNAAWL